MAAQTSCIYILFLARTCSDKLKEVCGRNAGKKLYFYRDFILFCEKLFSVITLHFIVFPQFLNQMRSLHSFVSHKRSFSHVETTPCTLPV